MKHKKLFVLSIFLLACAAQAEKMAAGIFKTDAGIELLTTFEKPCDPSSGNATLITSGKQILACWSAEGDKVKVVWLDGSASKTYEADNMVALGDVSVTSKLASVQSKIKKTHLTCDADGWTMEVDVERNETGELQRLMVSGDAVMANEKPTLITFSYDGLAFALNTVTAGFTYEPSGVQNFIRKKLVGGKTKGAGTCRITELVKKF